MPVHLFGRPAPIEELRALRAAADRGRRAGVRRARDRDEHRLDVQLLPDEEPLRARRRRPRRGRTTPSSPSGIRMLRFHGSRAKKDFELHRLQLAPRRDPGRDAARSSCRTSTGGTRAAPRGRRALRGARARRDRRAAARRAGPRLPHVLRPLARARPARRRARRGARSGAPRTTTPPLHLQPALRYLGYSEGDLPETEKAARENLCLPLWGGISEEQQAEVVAVLRRAVEPRPGVIALPVTRHRLWQLARRRGPDRRSRGGSRSSSASTRTSRATTGTSSRGRCSRSWSRSTCDVRRSSASTTAGGATSRRATCGAPPAASRSARSSPTSCSTRSRRSTPRGCRSAIAALDYLLLLAFVAGSRLLARSLIERPQSGLVARGKEVLIVGAGDAGQLLVREMQRNRALAYTPIGFVDDDPRKKNLRIHGVRVLGTTDELARDPPREPARRGADRDAVRAGRAAPQGRRRDARRGRPGQDAAGPARADRRRRQPRRPDPPGRRSRTCSAASRSRSTSRRSRRTSATAPCSSPARGGSIGSELCRQLVAARRRAARARRQGESALYEIERELVDERDFPAAIPVLADCGDAPKMRDVFERLPPAGRLPRGRVQARADARGEPAPGRDEQRARDARRSPRSRSSSASSGSC